MPSAIGSVVGGLFGKDTPDVPKVGTFQFPGLDSVAQDYLSVQKQNLSNPYTTYSPEILKTFQSQYNNPFASGYQTAANQAGKEYATVGTRTSAAAPQINDAALKALPAASQVLDMGFDPQGALYKMLMQNTIDTANVQNAQSGVSSSPYGSGVVTDAVSRFNLGWQEQQLQRALQALSGYTGAVQGAGAGAQTAAQLGTEGAALTGAAGQVPFAAANAITGSQSDALKQLLQLLGEGAGGFNRANLASMLAYLTGGSSQSNVGAELALKNYANELQAAQDDQAGLGNLVSNVGNLALTAAMFL